MKKLLLVFVVGSSLISGYGFLCFNMGVKSAYEDIISEKCWLSKDGARDIECTRYVKRSEIQKMKTYNRPS